MATPLSGDVRKVSSCELFLALLKPPPVLQVERLVELLPGHAPSVRAMLTYLACRVLITGHVVDY